MAQAWKVIASALQTTAKLLPPPADMAVELVATVAELTQKVLEAKEVSNENKKYVEQLANRAVDIASIIEKYVEESRWDETFSGFVTRFQATMKEVLMFVENFTRQRWLERLMKSSGVKPQCTDLWRQLDAIAVDFTTHFLRNMASKGPHERIEHPKLRVFWKQSMMNVHEAKWIHFWDQFTYEFASARPYLTGPSASSNKIKLEKKALPRETTLVGPWEINNLFQPPTCPVEHILVRVLDSSTVDDKGIVEYRGADEQPVVSRFICQEQKKPAKSREVHSWNGYYIEDSKQTYMTAELFIAPGEQVYGGGSDKVGDFTWTGECRGTQVHLIKQYIGQHQVQYEGRIQGTTIDGTWTIEGRYGCSGHFHLERQCSKQFSERRQETIIQLGEMQQWTGYYLQQGYKGDMIANIVFTDNQTIYGNGMDSIGRFTWLGRYRQGRSSMQVDLTKQYDGKHAVHYMGVISQQEDCDKVAMKGAWILPQRMDEGIFFLQLQVNN